MDRREPQVAALKDDVGVLTKNILDKLALMGLIPTKDDGCPIQAFCWLEWETGLSGAHVFWQAVADPIVRKEREPWDPLNLKL
jgi:hypothetical protein